MTGEGPNGGRRAQDDHVIEVTAEEFEAYVADALDAIPAALAELVDNVVILIEDEPPPGEPILLGQYVGVPLTARDSHYGYVLPDRIVVFRGPLQRLAGSVDELVREVTVTVVHEIAHHFGIDEDRLHEMGWG